MVKKARTQSTTEGRQGHFRNSSQRLDHFQTNYGEKESEEGKKITKQTSKQGATTQLKRTTQQSAPSH